MSAFLKESLLGDVFFIASPFNISSTLTINILSSTKFKVVTFFRCVDTSVVSCGANGRVGTSATSLVKSCIRLMGQYWKASVPRDSLIMKAWLSPWNPMQVHVIELLERLTKVQFDYTPSSNKELGTVPFQARSLAKWKMVVGQTNIFAFELALELH